MQVDTLKEREMFLGRMDFFLNEDFPRMTITDQQMFERSGTVNYITALLTLPPLIDHHRGIKYLYVDHSWTNQAKFGKLEQKFQTTDQI